MESKTDTFHSHLDKCKHCRNNPMMLCPLGGILLSQTAYEDTTKTKVEMIKDGIPSHRIMDLR